MTFDCEEVLAETELANMFTTTIVPGIAGLIRGHCCHGWTYPGTIKLASSTDQNVATAGFKQIEMDQQAWEAVQTMGFFFFCFETRKPLKHRTP